MWVGDIDRDRDELESLMSEERARLEPSSTEGDGGRWADPARTSNKGKTPEGLATEGVIDPRPSSLTAGEGVEPRGDWNLR